MILFCLMRHLRLTVICIAVLTSSTLYCQERQEYTSQNHIPINIKGVSRKAFNEISGEILEVELRKDLAGISCHKIIDKGMEPADQHGIDLLGIRNVDNASWIPDSTGPGGPEGPYRQVQSPPVPSISFISNIEV